MVRTYICRYTYKRDIVSIISEFRLANRKYGYTFTNQVPWFSLKWQRYVYSTADVPVLCVPDAKQLEIKLKKNKKSTYSDDLVRCCSHLLAWT